MPAPLPPHHYPELKPRRKPLIAPGTFVNLLHSLYYLVPFLVLAGIGWWAYTLQNYPQVRHLPLANGQVIHARIEGRDDNMIKYTDVSSGAASFVPIDSLSRWGKLMAWIMPVNTSFSFPIVCSLTDHNGKIVRVRIDGHSDRLVKFTLLSNGVEYMYPFANLSVSDQAWIRRLPASEEQALDTPQNAQTGDPVYVQHLESRMAELAQEILDDRARAAEPYNTGVQREDYLKQIKDDEAEIQYIKNKLSAELKVDLDAAGNKASGNGPTPSAPSVGY